MGKKYVIGVDLGGTKINCAIADLEGKILSNYIVPTNAEYGELEVLNRIIIAIEKAMRKIKEICCEILKK